MKYRISVVIPTKDRPEYLRACVASVLAEFPSDAEILVIDDNGSFPAAGALKEMDQACLRILHNKGTTGPSGARNFGVSQARYEIILFLDDDDLLRPGYIAYVAQLAQSVRYGFSATHPFKEPPIELPNFIGSSVADVGSLPFRKQLAGLGCGFWIMRQDFLSLGGLDETLLVNEDTDFSIRILAAKVPGAYHAEPGVFVRTHGAAQQGQNVGQITKRSKAVERAGFFTRILEKNAEFFATHPVADQYIRKRRAKMFAKAGRFSEGLTSSAPSLPTILYFLVNFVGYRIRRP